MELTIDGNLRKCEKVEEFSQMTTTARGIEGRGGGGGGGAEPPLPIAMRFLSWNYQGLGNP